MRPHDKNNNLLDWIGIRIKNTSTEVYRSEVRRHARRRKPGRRKHGGDPTDISSTLESVSVSDGAPMEIATVSTNVLTTLSAVATIPAATEAAITTPQPDFAVTAVASTPLLQTQTSTSAKKLDFDETGVDETPSYYLFMDTSILFNIVELIGTCPLCYRKTKVNLRHDIEKKKMIGTLPNSFLCKV